MGGGGEGVGDEGAGEGRIGGSLPQTCPLLSLGPHQVQ